MVEALRPSSDWHGHIYNKIYRQANNLKNNLSSLHERSNNLSPDFESLNLRSSRRLFDMNNISPVVEKILGYSVSRGEHIEDTMTLSFNVLTQIMRNQPDLFAKLISDYGLSEERAIKHCVEYMRLHDAATLSLQGMFHGRLKVGDDVYHEDKALLEVFNGNKNYDPVKEILFDNETIEYYQREGIELDIIKQIAEDSVNGRTLLGRMLKKGVDCASFDWMAYTLRDFSELMSIFNVDEEAPFSEKIDSVINGLRTVSVGLEKENALRLPVKNPKKRKAAELLSSNIVRLEETNDGLRLVYDAYTISKIYTMHILLRLYLSGAPWLQGAENTAFSLFKERYKRKPEQLLNLLLTTSEEGLLEQIKKDLNLTRSKRINLSKPSSIPSKLKGWRYSTMPKEGSIRKKIIFKDIGKTLVRGDSEEATFSEAFSDLYQLTEVVRENTPLFLQKKVIGNTISEIERPNSIDLVPKNLRPYAESLYKAGRKELIPLLNKETEKAILKMLEEIVVRVLNNNKVSSQPDRDPETSKKIRDEIEELLEQSGINKVLSVRVIEPEVLYGLHAPYVLKKTLQESKRWALTDVGNSILSLKRSPSNNNSSIFMVAGRARDVSGSILPGSKRKEQLDIKAYRLSVIRNLVILKRKNSELKIDIPQSDFDFVLVNGADLETISKIISRSELRKENLSVQVKRSSRRPFDYVQLGYTGHSNISGGSVGEFFYPSNHGNYAKENGLLPSLMEDGPRVDIPVMLIPYHHKKENTWMIWGLTVDFFNGYEDISRHRLENQTWLDNRLGVAYYPFPELAFISGSERQDLYRLRYAIRSWGWGNKHPIIRPVNRRLSEDELDDPEITRGLSKETQLFMTERVIYPLANRLGRDKRLIGNLSQRLKNGISLLTDIAIGLDGDPVATLLRMLPAGYSLTRGNNGIYATNTNVYGFGIFDKNGLFPEMGKLLENPVVLRRLAGKIFDYLKYLLIPPENRKSHEISNRRLFFDFLFELTEGDPALAFDLLRPVWCDFDEWRRINYVALSSKLVKLDQRFSKIYYRYSTRKEEVRKRVYSFMRN